MAVVDKPLESEVDFEDARWTDGVSVFSGEDFWGAQETWAYLPIEVPPGSDRLTVTLTGGTGDADLYVGVGEPTLDHFLCRSMSNGNEEVCVIEDPAPGTYTVGLYAYYTFDGVDISAQVASEEVLPPPTGVVLNEILLDGGVEWDANCNGHVGWGRSSYIEVANAGSEVADLEGVRLVVRDVDAHVFSNTRLEPGAAVVVSTGPSACFTPGTEWQPATGIALWSMDLTGEVLLFAADGQVMDATNGPRTVGHSVARIPDFTGDFVGHPGGAFSPGERNDGGEFVFDFNFWEEGAQHCDRDPMEPNVDPDTAPLLRAGDPLAMLVSNDDHDLFQVPPLEAGRVLTVQVNHTHALGDVDLSLFDGQGNLLASATSSDDNETLTFSHASAEPVAPYVEVRATGSDTCVPYVIEAY